MSSQLEQLIDEFVSFDRKTEELRPYQGKLAELERKRELLPSLCETLVKDWKKHMNNVYDVKLWNDSREMWQAYRETYENYVSFGAAYLSFKEWRNIYLDRSASKNKLQDQINAVVLQPWTKLCSIEREFTENKNSNIAFVGKHLNCFNLPPSKDFTTRELPIPQAVNWEEAIRKAKDQSMMFSWGVFSRQEFKDLQARTNKAVEEYGIAVYTQRKLIRQIEDEGYKANQKAAVLKPIFAPTSKPLTGAEVSAKNAYRAKVESGACRYFHNCGDYKFYNNFPRETQDFEAKWGIKLNSCLQRLRDIEDNLVYYESKLKVIVSYYPTVPQDKVLDFFRGGGSLMNLHLPEDKYRLIDCPSAYKVSDATIAKRKEILKSFSDQMGFAPDQAIFTNLHDKETRIPLFTAAMKDFERRKTAELDQEIGELKAKLSTCAEDYDTRRKQFINKFQELTAKDPAANGFWCRASYSAEILESLINAVTKSASGRFSLPCFVNPFKNRREGYNYPDMINWQKAGASCNLEYVYKASGKEQALRCMNAHLLTILLAFPIKNVKLTFMDPSTSNDCSFFTTRLGAQICSVVNRETDIRQLVDKWQAKAALVGKYTSDLMVYNTEKKTFLAPYELVVLLGKFSPSMEAQLEPFVRNGHKYGVYFFSFTEDSGRGNLFTAVKWRDDWPPKETTNCFVSTPVCVPALMDAFVPYINEHASKEESVKAISQDLEAALSAPYGDAIRDFAVPVGEVNGHHVHFKLSNHHIHSFVIGQTGQGKSVFLHDVISGAIMGYSPEQFQVYLMDFKLAGEELYHYKDVKHVRALLANGSELQLTYEILNDLRRRMEERSALMREAGARTIEEYDESAKEKFPRILLVVDECQELFRDNTHRQVGEGAVMMGIRSIIEDIARKGRSQGVHLLFATQTLSGTQLPPVIKNNITDYFLFKCVQDDAEQLVPGSSKKVSQLKVGHLLYNSTDGESTFQAYLPDVTEMVSIANKKASAVSVEQPGFVFDGSLVATLGEEEAKDIRENTVRNLRYMTGKSADVKRFNVEGVLKNDMGENMLFVGYNASQVARASFNTLLSLMISNKAGNLGYKFYCLDLLQSEEEDIYKPLDALSQYGLLMIPQSRSGELISSLAAGIREGVMKKTVLFILGQERFKAVRDEYELPSSADAQPDSGTPRSFGRPQPKTYRSELRYILENGPEMGVHCLLQIDRLSKLLFESSVNSRFVYRMFSYVCLLRTEKDAEVRLGLDGIYPQQLSDQDSNLGAWFINDGMGKTEKFNPFSKVEIDTIEKLLK